MTSVDARVATARDRKVRPPRLHVAIIMDGNRRWARQRDLPPSDGHQAGVEAARRVVYAAPRMGAGVLSLFALSSDNWQRPRPEVGCLIRLMQGFLLGEVPRLARAGIRLTVIGRRDRLPRSFKAAVEQAEQATVGGERMHLRLAIDYSGRDAIVRTSDRLRRRRRVSRDEFSLALGRMIHHEGPAPDVDLLIRTGGERRLSDFLLWESAYAELLFTDVMWPDFAPSDLEAGLEEFRRRDRRFGCDPPAVVQTTDTILRRR